MGNILKAKKSQKIDLSDYIDSKKTGHQELKATTNIADRLKL